MFPMNSALLMLVISMTLWLGAWLLFVWAVRKIEREYAKHRDLE